MSAGGWVTAASMLVVLALLVVVAVDRNRIKQRLADAEGAVTGLGLDVAAMAERIVELQSYLGSHSSWAVDATAPALLADPQPVDRWTRHDPRRSPSGPAGTEHSRTPQSAGRTLPAEPSA